MPVFINDFFVRFFVTNPNEQLMLTGLVAAAVLCLVLRIVLAISYHGQNALVALAAKEMKSKEDIDALRLGPFARAAKEYVLLGDRGITRIDTRAIVEKNMLKMHFLLWNCKSMESFVTAIEFALLPIGFLFTFFAAEAGRPVFLVFIVSVFLAARVIAAVLDFNVAKDKFVTNTVYLLDKEIGRFFTSDAAAAITVLREELKTGMAAQSEALSAAITKMGDDFSTGVTEALQDMTAGVERTAEAVTKSAGDLLANMSAHILLLNKPLADWEAAIASASDTQAALNTSLISVNTAIDSFASIIGGMGSTLGDYKTEMLANSQTTEAQITRLTEALAVAHENNAAATLRNDAVEAQLQTVREYQTTLEHSVQQYEASLRGITANLGESMGKMVDFHLQQSYSALTGGVKESMTQITLGNSDLLGRLQTLFEQMQAQSRSETAAILRVKEQMDMHFADLKAQPTSNPTEGES